MQDCRQLQIYPAFINSEIHGRDICFKGEPNRYPQRDKDVRLDTELITVTSSDMVELPSEFIQCYPLPFPRDALKLDVSVCRNWERETHLKMPDGGDCDHSLV
jgi:hypothetical protein